MLRVVERRVLVVRRMAESGVPIEVLLHLVLMMVLLVVLLLLLLLLVVEQLHGVLVVLLLVLLVLLLLLWRVLFDHRRGLGENVRNALVGHAAGLVAATKRRHARV